MIKSPPLIGNRYGRLLVLAEASLFQRPHIRRRAWICACDCGGFKIAQSQSLKTGETRSCGCLRAERWALRNPNRSTRLSNQRP